MGDLQTCVEHIMIIRTLWRRTAFFFCFLIAVGIVEYVVVVQLHSSLRVGEREEERLLAGGGRSFTLLEREAEQREEALMQVAGDWQSRKRERSYGVHGGGGGGGKDDDNLDGAAAAEVRLARELHDLRVDRLRNFERRTGSFLADQQRQNFEARRESQLAAVNTNEQDQLQPEHQYRQLQQGARSNDRRLSFSELLNLSRLVDEILSPQGRGEQALRQFFEEGEGNRLKEKLDKLYDVYAAKGPRGTTTDARTREGEYEEEYTGLKYFEEEEEEEEEDYKRVFNPDDFIISVGSDGKLNVSRKPLPPEELVENMTFPVRNMTPSEKAGLNILLSIRTTVSNHRERLPLLFDTWLTKVNTSQVFLVTDGDDPFTRLWTSVKGIHYVDAKCGNSYSRDQLCCKAGVELALLFEEQNKAFDWLCHVDDDMYVNMRNLVDLLSGFDPKGDPIYLGRSGSSWYSPRRVKRKAGLSQPGAKYHFAVGGMYCLSRAMLNKTQQWIVGGESLSKSCSLTKEPEDVTVGFIVAMQNYSLSRTERINTHGLHLATTVDPSTLHQQVAVSYGYGSVHWGEDPYNAVFVPDALFALEEDESQFRSLHCLLYPTTSWCVSQQNLLRQLRRRFFDNLNLEYEDEDSQDL